MRSTAPMWPRAKQSASAMTRDNSPLNPDDADRSGLLLVAAWLATGTLVLGAAWGPSGARGQSVPRPHESRDVLEWAPEGSWAPPDPPGQQPGSYPAYPQLGSQPPNWDTAGQPWPDSTATGSSGCGWPCFEPTRPFWRAGHWAPGGLGRLFRPPEAHDPDAGQALPGADWLDRPFNAGWFVGMLQGSSLVDDWVAGKQGFIGGFRLGWDFRRHWGCEMRLAFGGVALCDSQRAKDAQRAADDALGLPENHPFRRRFDRRRDANTCLWDVDLLYYPWGDTAWRPYLMAGLGTARIEFSDRLSVPYEETVFGLPLALGVKYRYNDWIALRLELADNIAFGQSFNTVHHLSLTGGMDVRFGGRRVAYWPWNPGRHYW